ncbi:von Willebrand factor D and EGF domain-containing protein-like, partial [Homarus americanus]
MGFVADEEDSDSPPCSDTPARIPNTEMFVKVEGYHVVAFCLLHYKTTFNTSFVDIKCVAGEWRMEDVPHNEVMECVIECMPPCQHGRCALYNNSTACICPPLYSGRSCEVQGCKALPLKFRCENGDWKVKVPWAERYLDFNETHCTYTCVPACQNNATCVKSNEGKTFCQCVPGYTGTHCESKKCQDVTLSGISLSNIETGHSGYTGIVWKDCPTGYIHTSTDKNTYVEKCKDGIWMTTPGQCIPLCESHCLHGGTCVAPNTCACPTGVLGQTCDGDTCVKALTPTINRAIYKNEVHSLTITCETGYRFSSGDHELNFTCVKGKWDFSKQKPYPCVPYCGDIICTNGGTCDGPNLCKCPPQYTGKQCDVERCSELPRYLIHSSGSFSSPEMNQYTIRCDAGYELITRNTSLILSCKNGVWQFPQAFHSLFHIACHPVCRPPCFNGGRCVAPNVCRCPEGFTGKICSWRYNKTIQKDMDCKFPFEYKNRWYFSCTTAFHYLPWCATEVTPDGILVTWSICFADMGKMKVIATEGGERCYFPFYHEGHVYHSCTSIGQDRPWCATSVTPSGLVNTTDFCVSALWGAEEVILTVHGNECKSSFRYKEPKPSTFGEESYVKCAIKQVNTQNTLNKEVVLFDLGYQHTTLTKTGKLCMFPFMYDGEQYYTCIQRGHKALWCATNVDTNGTILKDDFCINSYYLDQGVRDLELAPAYVPSFTTKEFYIRSMRLVRALSGNRCVFPFLYQEKAFYACIYRDADVPWCATQVDNDGHVIVRTACPADWGRPPHIRQSVIRFHRWFGHNLATVISNFALVSSPTRRYCFGGATSRLSLTASKKFQVQQHLKTSKHIRLEAVKSNSAQKEQQLLLACSNNFYYRYDLSRRIAVRNKIPMSVSGLRCQLFLYKGKLVEGCVKEEGQELWCAVQTTKEKLLAAADFCIDTYYMTLLINKTTYGLLDPSYTKG